MISQHIQQPQVPTIQRFGGMVMSKIMKHSVRTLDLRSSYYDRSVDPASEAYNQHVIFVFWHEYIYPLLPQWANCPLTLLVSQHRDAEWLNQAALRMGYEIVRGSTNRGGSAAIRSLKNFSQKSSFAITPDGPRGPRREMALGPIFLASLFNMPIVPVGVGCDRPWRMSTWDRFAIPRPLSRVRVVFGPKILLPKKRKADHEMMRQKIESLIHQLTSFAENWAATGRDVILQSNRVTEPVRRRGYFEASKSGELRGNHDDSTTSMQSSSSAEIFTHKSPFPPLAA